MESNTSIEEEINFKHNSVELFIYAAYGAVALELSKFFTLEDYLELTYSLSSHYEHWDF